METFSMTAASMSDQGLPEDEILRLMENEATNNPRKFS
jgi:hypothetical protein